jgi:hypothetical protein
LKEKVRKRNEKMGKLKLKGQINAKGTKLKAKKGVLGFYE